jgi:hypothetical protein
MASDSQRQTGDIQMHDGLASARDFEQSGAQMNPYASPLDGGRNLKSPAEDGDDFEEEE